MRAINGFKPTCSFFGDSEWTRLNLLVLFRGPANVYIGSSVSYKVLLLVLFTRISTTFSSFGEQRSLYAKIRSEIS